MADSHPAVPSKAAVHGHPLHPMLIPLPIGMLVALLASDIAFWATRDPFWARASLWLSAAGLVTGLVAAVPGIIDFAARERIRALSTAWIHGIGNVVAMLLTLWSVLHRSSDAVAGALPLGLILSIVVVAILLVTGWLGGELSYRYKIGVIEDSGSARLGSTHGRM